MLGVRASRFCTVFVKFCSQIVPKFLGEAEAVITHWPGQLVRMGGEFGAGLGADGDSLEQLRPKPSFGRLFLSIAIYHLDGDALVGEFYFHPVQVKRLR